MVPITVTAYAGYQNPESPRSFIYKGQTITIRSVENRGLEETTLIPGHRRLWFQVKDGQGRSYHIYYVPETDVWYLKEK